MDGTKFPLFQDERGTLCSINLNDLPFAPKRFFWIFDVKDDKQRAGHAHKICQQLLFCQQGKVQLSTTDIALQITNVQLSPGETLFLNCFNWLEIKSMSSGAVLGVFASHPYDRSEYIEDFDNFIQMKNFQV